ncbi:MAG: hypothetical protein ABR924_18905 [Terracidiphilus sp.]
MFIIVFVTVLKLIPAPQAPAVDMKAYAEQCRRDKANHEAWEGNRAMYMQD